MNTAPRIELDPSRLLGFKRIRNSHPGRITGPRAKVGSIIAVVPEPSSYVELAVGLLCFAGFFLYRRLRARNAARL